MAPPPNVTTQTISNRIDVERKYLGLSMRELSAASGVSVPALYRFLHDGKSCQMTTALALLAAVGLTFKVERSRVTPDSGSYIIERQSNIKEGRRRANVPTPGKDGVIVHAI